MQNLTQAAINNNRVTWSLLLIIMLMGITQYNNMSRDSMPPFTVRVATVVSSFPGASPERVELLVTKPVEEKIQEVPEVKEISSQSRTGVSVITITLKDEVSPDILQNKWDLIRRKLNNVENLPDGIKPQLNDDGVGEVYGIFVGMTGDDFSYKELEDIADDLRDRLIKIDEAAKVEIQGKQDQRIYIDYDNAELARYGVNSTQLESLIQKTNILFSGGEVNANYERIIVEPSGNFNSIQDLKNLVVPVTGNKTVHLADISSIYESYVSPVKSKVRINGKEGLSLAISLKDNANIIHLGQKVDALLKAYQQIIPVGIELQRISSLDTFVNGEVKNFISNLIQSIVIVLLVMLFFLGIRTGMIIASLIPIVTIATLMYMGMVNLGLNQVTLAGLIMALGMMVDNAVVVSESIMVKINAGQEKLHAATETCRELFTPLLISTLTTSFAFMSFYLAESVMGDIVGPLFLVISSALIFSWLFSFSVIAMLCFYFLQNNSQEKETIFDRFISWLKKYYIVLISKSLSMKYLVLTGIGAAFILSISLFSLVPFLFFPDSTRNMITMDINLPLGTRIETTENIVKNIEKHITKNLLVSDTNSKGITHWSSFIGEGPESYDLGYTPDEPNSSYAHLLINTSSGEDNDYVIEQLDAFNLTNLSEADIKVKRLGQGGGGTPIEVFLIGNDPNTLLDISNDIRKQLKNIAGTKNVKDNWGIRSKKLMIDINSEKAQQFGLNNQDIALALQTNLSGRQTGVFRENEDNIPIIMRNQKSEQLNVDNINELSIRSQSNGTSVPLLEIANIEPQWQLSRIRHRDLKRAVTISSELKTGFNASQITKQLEPWLSEQATKWPLGYSYEYGGEDKNASENFAAVLKYLPLCGFLIILLLILQFNSIRKTSIVLTTIPLGLVGVVIGLLVFRSFFGFMAFLGMISLAGIVINNAIVLIDRIELELSTTDAHPIDAIKQACLQRFRPILLTTFTTILGMIPLYLSGGPMWEPMAVVIMSGLLFGTMITLLFVPISYAILYRYKTV